MIIGISGKIGSGKDLTGNIIQYLFVERDLPGLSFENFQKYKGEVEGGWQIKKFAGKLKQIASLLTGIPVNDFEKSEVKNSNLGREWDDMTVREFLQVLGTDAIRNNLHSNAWSNALFTDYKPLDRWIITDVRFPNELDAIDKRNGLCIRLTRNGDIKSNHLSETALDGATFDYIIENNGTIEDLILKVKGILLNEDIL